MFPGKWLRENKSRTRRNGTAAMSSEAFSVSDGCRPIDIGCCHVMVVHDLVPRLFPVISRRITPKNSIGEMTERDCPIRGMHLSPLQNSTKRGLLIVESGERSGPDNCSLPGLSPVFVVRIPSGWGSRFKYLVRLRIEAGSAFIMVAD